MIIHLCAFYKIDKRKDWYDHRSTPVLENEGAEMLWDFNICTDRVVETGRLNIAVVDKQNLGAIIMGIVVSEDFGVKGNEFVCFCCAFCYLFNVPQ